VSRPDSAQAPKASSAAVTVFVPCGLLLPFSTAISAYRKHHPEVAIRGVYDNHIKLIARLQEGESGDVFVSPGPAEIRALERRRLVEAEFRVTLGSYLVGLVAPLERKGSVRTINDLPSPGVRTTALADPPRSPVGY